MTAETEALKVVRLALAKVEKAIAEEKAFFDEKYQGLSLKEMCCKVQDEMDQNDRKRDEIYRDNGMKSFLGANYVEVSYSSNELQEKVIRSLEEAFDSIKPRSKDEQSSGAGISCPNKLYAFRAPAPVHNLQKMLDAMQKSLDQKIKQQGFALNS